MSAVQRGRPQRHRGTEAVRTLTAKVDQVLPVVNEHASQIDELVPTINKSKEASGPRRCRRRVFVEPDVNLPDLDLPDR